MTEEEAKNARGRKAKSGLVSAMVGDTRELSGRILHCDDRRVVPEDKSEPLSVAAGAHCALRSRRQRMHQQQQQQQRQCADTNDRVGGSRVFGCPGPFIVAPRALLPLDSSSDGEHSASCWQDTRVHPFILASCESNDFFPLIGLRGNPCCFFFTRRSLTLGRVRFSNCSQAYFEARSGFYRYT